MVLADPKHVEAHPVGSLDLGKQTRHALAGRRRTAGIPIGQQRREAVDANFHRSQICQI
jgi:hypothetical protein